MRTRVFASVPFPDQMTLHLDPEHARILIGSDPETYIPHPGVWGERGWIHVSLSRIDHDVLVDLIYESWSRIAPTRLLSPAQD